MLSTYLSNKLGTGKSSNKDTIYPCPFCGRTKLYVITDHSDDSFGVYHCFHCGSSGSLIKLISTINNVSFSDAKLMLPDIDSYAVDAGNIEIADSTPEENMFAVLLKAQEGKKESDSDKKAVDLTRLVPPDKLPPKLPVGVKYLEENGDNPEATPFIAYLESRGISWEDIVYNHMGYIVHGGAFSSDNTFFPINNHVVFFCYDEYGKYQYWNTRAITPQNPKSINAPETPDHLGKGDVIFNLYPALAQRDIVLVEGIPDALTLGTRAIATYGKMLTDTQKALIINNIKPAQNLIIMLDMDAWDTMTALAIEMYKYHENTYLVYNPTREDANSLGRSKAYEIIESAIKATPKGIALFELQANLY